ncbi:restriction endonuclease subunit S [Vibrio splendidus]
MSELPKGWVKVKIEDIAEVKGGKRLPKGHELLNERTNYPYIRVTDFTHGTVGLTKIKYIDEYTHSYIKNYTISQDDLYISIAGTIGLVGQIPSELNNANLTENAAKISGLVGVDKRYLSYVLSSEIGVSQFNDKITSSGQPKLALFRIRECEFPLTPLNEQIRIANKLDSILAKVDKAQARLDKIPAILKRFRQSVLAAATSGELTKEWREDNTDQQRIDLANLAALKEGLIAQKLVKKDLIVEILNCEELPDSWVKVNLGGLASKVTDGEHKTPKRTDSGRYLLSARNVRDGHLSLGKVDYVGDDEFEKLRKRCDPNKGDVLISCSGSVGRIALCDKDDEYVMVRSAALVKTDLTNQNNTYLMYVLQSPQLQDIIVEKSKSTAQSNLFLAPIKELPIPLAPVAEQLEIVRQVERLLEKADRVEKQYLDAKARLDRLTQSILAKAFRGELVPQDPSDESAEKLLERILAEREQAKPKKATRKRTTKAKTVEKG